MTDQPDAKKPARRKRRWYQFRLRTLLIVTLLLGVLFGWVGLYCKRARDQQAAVEAILEMGGEVEYYYQQSSESYDPAAGRLVPPGPRWLRERLGEHFFARVESVKYPLGAGDADLVHLKYLRGLSSLDLHGTRVTDAGMQQIADLKSLEVVDLSSTFVTDAGLRRVENHPHIGLLDLDHTAVTDASVDVFVDMPSLSYVFALDTHITEEGRRRLADVLSEKRGLYWGVVQSAAPSERFRQAAAALEQLGAEVTAMPFQDEPERLSCTATIYGGTPAATPEGMAHLANLIEARRLDFHDYVPPKDCWCHLRPLVNVDQLVLRSKQLADTDLAAFTHMARTDDLTIASPNVTDAGLAHLAGFSRMQSLYFECPQITDAGLVHLRDMADLKSLYLRYSKVGGPGLVHIADKTQLEELSFEDGGLTDPGLAHLAGLKQLKHLSLRNTPIKGPGLAHLTGLAQLEYLDLYGTQVTDPCLKYLYGLTNLETLHLDRARITRNGYNKIQKMLPDTHITY